MDAGLVHRVVVAGVKLYWLVTGAHGCEQLAQSRYAAALGRGSNSRPLDRKGRRHCATGWFVVGLQKQRWRRLFVLGAEHKVLQSADAGRRYVCMSKPTTLRDGKEVSSSARYLADSAV